MTRLPFGKVWVTTAATLVASCSARRTEPEPSLDESESSFRNELGSEFFFHFVSAPKKFSAPRSSPFLRLRLVVLSSWALSVTLTLTVTRSPTSRARWSLKKAREPVRQSEFGA